MPTKGVLITALILAMGVALSSDWHLCLHGQVTTQAKQDTDAIPPDLLHFLKRDQQEFRGIASDFERALIALSQLMKKPNPPLAAQALTTCFLGRQEDIGGAIGWLLYMVSLLPPKEEQNWWHSLVELLEQALQDMEPTDPNFFEDYRPRDRLFWCIWTWMGPAIHPLWVDPINHISSTSALLAQELLKGADNRRKELRESFVDFIFRSNPEIALYTMHHIARRKGDIPDSPDIDPDTRPPLDHVIHFVQVASTRIRMQRAQKRDIELAQERLRWLLGNYPYWWAKRYAIEVLLRDPELKDDDFLPALHKEKHPWVAKRFQELQKKLREDSNAMPKPR